MIRTNWCDLAQYFPGRCIFCVEAIDQLKILGGLISKFCPHYCTRGRGHSGKHIVCGAHKGYIHLYTEGHDLEGVEWPMKYKELTIQIPEPDEDGTCNRKCTGYSYDGEDIWCLFKVGTIYSQTGISIRPSKGCPWWEEGK